MSRDPNDRRRPIFAACVAAIVLATGYAAIAQTRKPPTTPPSNDLEQKVAALERRTKQLEDQLAVMQQAKAAGEAVAKSAPAGDKGLTVQVPFTVVDQKGKIVMRVQDAGMSALSRGLYVYDSGSDGPMAYVGASSEGGRIYAAGAKATRPDVQMMATPGGPVFILRSPGGAELVRLDKLGITLLNSKENVASRIGLKDDRGLVEVDDASGMKMVEAGSLPNGKGYVLANPFTPNMTAAGNPSMLLGGSKK